MSVFHRSIRLDSSVQSTSTSGTGPQRSYAKLPAYLHRRGSCFYFKRKIPADVLRAFPGERSQVWKSLDTHLLEKARVMLAVEVSEFDFRVARYRRECAAKLAGLAPEAVVKRASSGLFAALMAEPTAEELARIALVRTLEENLEKLREMTPGAAIASAGGSGGGSARPSAITNPSVLAVASAQSKAAAPPPKPALQLSSPTVKGKIAPTMLHLLEDWKRKQTRHRTVKAFEMAVHEFREIHGSPAVEDITRQHARDYRDQLIERRLSRGTIENRIGYLSTLVRHGMVEMVEDLAANPFERIDLTGANGARPAKDRRAYDIAELNLLYASAVYTKGQRSSGQVGEAAYWVPLLGPFVGPRIEELCQVRVEDVQRINGEWCLRLCDLDENQQIKNDGSFRRVPLHSSIIRCGFLAYVAQVAKAGHERIFPTLSNDNSNRIYSNAVGKWFGRYLESIGLSDPRLDYHSFRYSFRQQCSLSGVETETRDALTGHWVGASDGGRTYLKGENNQYPFPKLVSAMKQLRYDELRIAHLFVKNPMAEVEETLLR